MSTIDETHAQLIADLEDLLGDRAHLLAGLVAPELAERLGKAATQAARRVAAELAGNDRAAAEAARSVATLAHGDAPPPASWWPTPIGRAVARAIRCAPGEAVPVAEAARMLGISRQRAHRLVTTGKLQRGADGGVALQSVFNRLAGRRAAS